MSHKQIEEYDTLRAVITTLVLIGHCTYYVIDTSYGGCDYSLYAEPTLSLFYRVAVQLTDLIYTFHMPLNMALSGALYYVTKNCQTKCNS